MKTIYCIIAMCLSLCFVISCGGDTNDGDNIESVISGIKDSEDYKTNDRTTFIYNVIAEDPSAAISAEYSTAINTFAVNLTSIIYSDMEGENLVLSPYCLSRSLAVLTEGAVGETREELIDAIGGEVALDNAEAALKEILYADDSIILQCADAFWYASNRLTVKDEFHEIANTKYGVEFTGLDFSDASNSASTINDWISTNTNGNIEGFIEPDDIDDNTAAFLTSTIYFEADWTSPFNIEETELAAFESPDGSVDVEMMTSDYYFATHKTESYENVKLYYGTNSEDFFYLDVYMPTASSITYFLENECLEAMTETADDAGSLTMPKFFFESELDLKAPLQELGIQDIFIEDTTGLSELLQKEDGSTDYIYVSKIKQKSGIKSDEEGTVAYSVTVTEGDTAAVGMESPDVQLDKPFVYFIRAGENGLVLFSGVVNNPNLN